MKSKDSGMEDEEPRAWSPVDACSGAHYTIMDLLEASRRVRDQLLQNELQLTATEVMAHLHVAIGDADPVEYLELRPIDVSAFDQQRIP